MSTFVVEMQKCVATVGCILSQQNGCDPMLNMTCMCDVKENPQDLKAFLSLLPTCVALDCKTQVLYDWGGYASAECASQGVDIATMMSTSNPLFTYVIREAAATVSLSTFWTTRLETTATTSDSTATPTSTSGASLSTTPVPIQSGADTVPTLTPEQRNGIIAVIIIAATIAIIFACRCFWVRRSKRNHKQQNPWRKDPKGGRHLHELEVNPFGMSGPIPLPCEMDGAREPAELHASTPARTVTEEQRTTYSLTKSSNAVMLRNEKGSVSVIS